MARLVPVRCPNCGANVRIDPDRDIATCDYCKTSSFVQTRTRPVPEAVRRDNAPVINVEAFRSSVRTGMAVLWIYLFFAFGAVVVAIVAFVASQARRSVPASAPKDDDALARRVGEGQDPPAETAKVAEGPTEPGSRLGTKPTFSAGDVVVSGRLSSEVVQKVVRQHYNRFGFCHQQAVRRGGSAYGIVTIRFVIGRDGGVSNTTANAVSVGSSTYVECVDAAFKGMLFPKPAGGIVTVVYPLVAVRD